MGLTLQKDRKGELLTDYNVNKELLTIESGLAIAQDCIDRAYEALQNLSYSLKFEDIKNRKRQPKVFHIVADDDGATS
jgi:hypothetical protein